MLIEIKEMSTFEQKTFKSSKNERKICFKITAQNTTVYPTVHILAQIDVLNSTNKCALQSHSKKHFISDVILTCQNETSYFSAKHSILEKKVNKTGTEKNIKFHTHFFFASGKINPILS